MSFKTSEALKKGLFVSGHALISVLMLLQSLAIQISIPETVLCIGDDGHIMVEREGIDIHCEYPAGADLIDEIIDYDSHEDNCVDIPLEKHPENAELKKTTDHKTNISHRHNYFAVDLLNRQVIETQKSFLDGIAILVSPAINKSVVLLI